MTRRLVLAAFAASTSATGCFHTVTSPRPTGKDCILVNATFRETQGGVGPEVADVDGIGFSTVTWYARCPKEQSVPPGLAQSWVRHWAQNPNHPSRAPFDAVEQQKWTDSVDGVMYRFTKYALFFRGCDFWYNTKGGDPEHPNSAGPLAIDTRCDPPHDVASSK